MISKAKYEAMQAHRAKLMEEHGFLIDFVFPCEHEPDQDWDIHTHGLVKNFNHPEIQICLGLSQEVVMPILHSIVRRIKEGERFEHGHVDHEIAQDMPTYFIHVNNDKVRLIIPDANGNYREDEVTGIYKHQYHAHPEQFTPLH